MLPALYWNGCSLPKTYKLSDVSCFMSTLFPSLLQFLVRDYTGSGVGQYLGHANVQRFEQTPGFDSGRGDA